MILSADIIFPGISRDRNAAEKHITSILPFPELLKVSFKVNTAFGVCLILVLKIRSILALCFKIHGAQSQLLFEIYYKPFMWFRSRPAFWHSICLFISVRRRKWIMAKTVLYGKHPGNKTMPFFFSQVLFEKQLQTLLVLKLSEPSFNTALEHQAHCSCWKALPSDSAGPQAQLLFSTLLLRFCYINFLFIGTSLNFWWKREFLSNDLQ